MRGSRKAQEEQKWRIDCEHSGALRVLEWGGVTRTTAQWPKKWAAVRRGSLYVLNSEDSDAQRLLSTISGAQTGVLVKTPHRSSTPKSICLACWKSRMLLQVQPGSLRWEAES